MVKEHNIGIKLELCKDKTSGKLTITARFDSNAKNVIIDNNNYFWMPTNEEKDLINEAFDTFYGKTMTQTTKTNTNDIENTAKPESTIDSVINEQKKNEKPINEEKTITAANIDNNTENKPPIPEMKQEPSSEALPPLEKDESTSVFEITDEDIKKDEPKTNKDNKKDDLDPKVKVNDPNQNNEEKNEKDKTDEDIIVEADDEAIEAAIKKHTEDDDNSIVEADEQTIIDKVLSQKKKGKWGKIK